jgi:hypothetical protein
VKRAAVLVAVLAVAGLLSACLPPPPPPPPPTPDKGFDACAAPSDSTMTTWKSSSPYNVVGVYIGGANRGCAQPNLTSTWLTSQRAKGWRMLPIWVGPQAPCTTLRTTTFSSDPLTAYFTGLNEGDAAANAATALGLPGSSAIYFDLEGYARGGACTTAVQSLIQGWVQKLNERGFRAGMYSSLCSGVLDAAATPYSLQLDAIWIAAWNNTPNIFGFTACGTPATSSNTLSDTIWSNHQRVHQYVGGHNESYGGITINIDNDAVDGPTG